MAVAAERTLIFQITPWRDRRMSRTVELRADQTLHDLHGIIRLLFYLDFGGFSVVGSSPEVLVLTSFL